MQPTTVEQLTDTQLDMLNFWDEMVEERDPQFNGRDGRWSITIALRTLAFAFPQITRREFVGAMVRTCNESTLRIQFNQSRKNSVEWFGATLGPDGALVE